ncbi:MAG TPA: peptide chain release factor 1 [Candidatus Omnitrophota bacterium]|nr:peptide chain release factor 1 [Candidatus Omnitrophota bacterium]HPD85035.1 peptide chain release factor 1 [Candidatus Omnitrophota bacterium]HRZ03893.1 peptide chain release factor 1 [Candidatus Omnitrophota bacterium]
MFIVEKFEKIEKRALELEQILGDPKVIADSNQYQKFAREFSEITFMAGAFREYKKIIEQVTELKKLLKEKHDKEFEELAKAEIKDLEKKQQELEDKLEQLFNAGKEQKDKDVIMEIRAGTGGAEASLFASDLYRMYTKYAAQKGWKVDSISSSASEASGFKEAIFSISGKEASRRLKWESGVHRVQRVPTTEASGRIHTSTATVAVLFEPEEVELTIDPKDLKIDVFRSSGPGGQSVNTTDSAVRLTHLPTGTVVVCQDERSQLKNKMKAMRVLRARILDNMRQQATAKASQERRAKIGTGDRSEKIRTYNFPDRRVTDHRIGFTTHQLVSVMDGELDELTGALMKAEAEAELELEKAKQ